MVDEKTPKSLFHQCIHFVAENIDIVDSFIGFPSQVAEQIFKLCVEKRKFMTKHLPSLSLFTSQFGSDLLDTLNLSGKYLCLNYFIDSFVLFTAIRKLDVSHCGIGDGHEILAYFANLTRLEDLNLSNNCISDAGIQKMTMPYRILKKGPLNFKHITLTGNFEVSLKSLKYLSAFKNLTVVLQGNFSVKEADNTNWHFTQEKYRHPTVIITYGWASRLIEDWITFVETQKSAASSRRQTFYTKPKCSQDVLSRQKYSDCVDCIIAQNKTAEKSRMSNNLSRVPKQENNEDVEGLMTLYKQTLPSSTDHYTQSFIVLDDLENNNPYPVTQLLCQQSKLKSNKGHLNTGDFVDAEISHENNKEKCSQDYNKPNISTVLKNKHFKTKSFNEDYKTHSKESVSAKAVLNFKRESRIDSDFDLNLANRDQTSRQLKVCTLNKKRKRIQIFRPDHLHVNEPAKYPRLESDCQTGTTSKQKPSFLECLDSFI